LAVCVLNGIVSIFEWLNSRQLDSKTEKVLVAVSWSRCLEK